MANELNETEKAAVERMKSEFMKMNVEKIESMIQDTAFVKTLKAQIEALQGAKTAEDITAIKTSIAAAEAELLKVKGQIEVKKAMKEIKDNSLAGYFNQGVRELFEKGMFAKLRNNAGMRLNVRLEEQKFDKDGLALKFDSPMSETTSVVGIGSGVPLSLSQYEPGLTRITRRETFIAQLVNVSRIMNEYAVWSEQTNVLPGAANQTAEGAAKTQGSFRWTESKAQVETITYYIKITKRMLDDLSIIENEIRTELMDVLAHKLDQQALAGSGVSPQLKGIISSAQAFANFGSLAPVTPNNYDVIVASLLQVRANGSTLTSGDGSTETYNIFTPTDIVMHPADVAVMGLTKDTLGRYITPYFVQNTPEGIMNKTIEGLKITENVGMTKGSFLVGDFKKANLRIREDANISIGYENDDFTKNLVTILGETRAVMYVKSNHANAFVTGTFAAGITALGGGL
jgi:hypothetical protein